ncbi:MAG TPA: hypothetical protein VF021_01925 [Longimicrobiales bacterium]
MLLFAIYLVLVIALPVALSGFIGFRSLPRGRACPNCAQETISLVSVPLRVAHRLRAGFSLQRRWCPTCDWDGYARRADSAPVVLLADPDAHHTQQVRTIDLGGRPWRVLLESWRERGRCYGRLTFVAPSGKQWCDPLPAFNGPTHHEVLGQALALSDRLLAFRLREVISG